MQRLVARHASAQSAVAQPSVAHRETVELFDAPPRPLVLGDTPPSFDVARPRTALVNPPAVMLRVEVVSWLGTGPKMERGQAE
jgi:hypothetical protein